MPIFISFNSFNMGYFIQPCNIACSMKHAPSTPSTYTGSCKTCFSHISFFGGKSFLIFPIIDLTIDLRSNLHILTYLTWLILWSLHTHDLNDTINPFGGFFSSFMVSWLWNFIGYRCVLALLIFGVSFNPFDIIFVCYYVHPCKSTYSWASSQGVQLLGRQNRSKIWATGLRGIQGSRHPNI